MNKAPAAYALCTPAKLDVGTTTPSLCRRTDDADIWHFFHRYFRKAVLAVKAVENACLNVRNTEGIILHSDLGSQYTSQTFEECLSRKGMVHSFSRKGNPYDNACMESFHSVLKKEEIYLHTYQDSKEARKAIFEYIEGWYNRKRIHSSIGYLTPQQKEDEELKKEA